MKQFFIFLFIPIQIYAQTANMDSASFTGHGIRFETGTNWEKVLSKAKAENKYIFLDCYTTWCGPCRQMEMAVYPLQKVGDLVNEKFIAVKAQMDSSKEDNATIKAFYPDAAFINRKYKIAAYPTFLFFTPDGKLLSRSVGATDPEGFIKMLTDVLSPETNYYTLLARYTQGKRSLVEMSYLANTAMALGDTLQSNEIVKTYYTSLDKRYWLTKENIEFLHKFTKNSKDIGFAFFYKHTDSIDSLMGDDTYSQELVENIIFNEMVAPTIVKAKNLDDTALSWTAIENGIKKKYNKYYADWALTAARVNWYGKRKSWVDWTKYYIIYLEKYEKTSKTGHWTAFYLNNSAWAIFTYSNDRNALEKALSWSSRAVMMDPIPSWMDTYANILYKLGEKDLALRWEKIAFKADPNNRDFQTALAKMEKGEPTWPL